MLFGMFAFFSSVGRKKLFELKLLVFSAFITFIEAL